MFVKIGQNQVVNMQNVVQISRQQYDNRLCIRIDFIGGEYERHYAKEPEYAILSTFIDEQPTLLHD